MNRKIQFLIGLLVAQLFLALGLGIASTSLSPTNANVPLLAADKDKVDRLTIEGPDSAKVVLAREAGSWKLPDEGGFPADGGRLKQILDHLAGIKLGIPVASSSDSKERFKVSDDAFERRITLGGGGKTLSTIYLGTSPGMRQVHARRGDQNDIYAIDLTTYELPVKAEEWEDKTVLQLSKDDVQSIEVGGLKVRRTLEGAIDATLRSAIPQTGPQAAKAAGPEWHAEGLAGNEKLNAAGADKLVAQLADLTIDSVLGTAEKPEYGIAQPVLTLCLTRKNGEQLEYRMGKMTDGQGYALKVSTHTEYFKLPGYAGQNLMDSAKREALVDAGTAPETFAKLKKTPAAH